MVTPTLMNRHDPREVAISIMAKLKLSDDVVRGQIKELFKQSRFFARSVLSVNVDGWTLYHAFALRGMRKLVKLALKTGIDPDLEMGQPEGLPGRCTALHLAAHRGDVSIISILLSHDADVNKKDTAGKMPIYYASRNKNSLAVRTLIKAGADVTDCDPNQIPRGFKSNSGKKLSAFSCTGQGI